MPINLHAIDPVELLPLPEVPERYGTRNNEEKRLLKLIRKGLESGPAIPVDDAFFEQLRSRIYSKL